VPNGDVEIWSACCDSSPDQHQSPGRPIGFDLCTTVLADTTAADSDFFFLRCAISNPTEDTFVGLHVGICCDPDIGTATDDRAGLILDKIFGTAPDTFRVRNTGFAWSQNPTPPGAVAIRYLSGPLGDTITAFKLFPLANDPITDTAQYMALAGYDWMTGEYLPFDSLDAMPDDKRFLIAAGPFTLLPQDTAVCWFAVIGADFTLGDTSALAATADAAFRSWQRMTGVAEPALTGSTSSLSVYPRVLRPRMTVRIGAAGEPVGIYDVRGVLVRHLPGSPAAAWDGTDTRGRIVPAGAYIVRASGAESKVVVVRQ
jgi:hypothetical protein